MNTRSPADFLQPFAGKIRRLLTLDIPGEKNAHGAELIAAAGRDAGIDAAAKPTLLEAIEDAAKIDGARVVICGSLYLAGHVLAENGTPPE
jgi:dihydrofolate synthase/folylpolyglutamate synthase